MKEKNFKADLEAVHQNALEMKKTLSEILSESPNYDHAVSIVIIDENGTVLSGRLSHIEVDEATISFSNFRQIRNGIISEMQLVRKMAEMEEQIDSCDLYDMSIELYNDKSALYVSTHITKVYRNPLGELTLSNEVNKNLKF